MRAGGAARPGFTAQAAARRADISARRISRLYSTYLGAARLFLPVCGFIAGIIIPEI